MIALLLTAFILYLYTPHLLFKFAAATKYDFITRKDLPQVEEFFAAGLPSLFLNGITFVVLWAAYRLAGAPPIVIDRVATSAAFRSEPDLSTYIATGDVRFLVCYAGALAFVSWWAGRAYGGVIRKVALAGGDEEYLQGALGQGRFSGLLLTWRIVQVLYRRSWRIFYAHYEHPLYPVVLRSSYAFVHTTHGLYHGILFQLDKKRDGDTDGIILVGVSRFSRKSEEECFRLGINPISDLSGPLFIKWEEIIDINYPPNQFVLANKRAFYDQKLKQYAAAKAKRHTRRSAYLALWPLRR